MRIANVFGSATLSRFLLAIALLCALACRLPARAQCSDCLHVDYESTLGMPATQCWNLLATGAGAAQLGPSGLVITSSSSIYAYESPRPAFRWADGCFMEARLRVPVGGVTSLPGLRATLFGGADNVGVIVHVWIWSSGVALSTDQNANAGPGLATLSFDAASAEHTYRLETDAVGAKLYIDEVLRLQLPYTNTSPVWRNLLNFGNDSRTSGLAITEWRYVRFGATTRPSDVLACGSGEATFSVMAQGTAPTFQWQWATEASGPWEDVVEGVNVDPAGGPIEFLASGSQAASLILSDFSAAGSASWYVRCQMTTSCGDTTSAPAMLTTCRADYDCNGTADVLDFLGFVDDFGACDGQTAPCGAEGDSDVNGDTVIDILDFLDFIEASANGC